MVEQVVSKIEKKFVPSSRYLTGSKNHLIVWHACEIDARMPGQADRLFAAMPCPSSSIENKLLETGQKAYILGTKQVKIILFVKLHCYLKDLNLVKN